MRFVDLSVCIENNCISEEVSAKIKYVPHKKGATLLGLGILWSGKSFIAKLVHFFREYFSGHRLKSADFPEGEALATETVTLTTHTGTHVDAPYHYGKDNLKISQIPLEYFYGDGVLLDFSNRVFRTPLSKSEIVEKLQEISYEIKEKDIVLICTGAYELFKKEEYKSDYFGLSKEALGYMLDQGVRMIGTDAFGLDQPFTYMDQKYRENHDKNELWPAHLYGRQHPYLMMEKLSNLKEIGRCTGFTVMAFPVSIHNASAGWARVVAMIDEEKEE